MTTKRHHFSLHDAQQQHRITQRKPINLPPPHPPPTVFPPQSHQWISILIQTHGGVIHKKIQGKYPNDMRVYYYNPYPVSDCPIFEKYDDKYSIEKHRYIKHQCEHMIKHELEKEKYPFPFYVNKHVLKHVIQKYHYGDKISNLPQSITDIYGMKYENPALRMKQKYDNPNNENKKIEKFRRLKLIKILKITENHPPPKNSFLPPAPPPTPQEFHFNEMISIVGTNMNSTELLERATEYKKGVLYYEESENIIIFDIKAYYNRLVFEGKTDVNNNYIPIYYIFEFLHNLGFTQIFVYDYSCNTIIKNMKNSHKSIFDEAEFVGSLSHSGGSGNGSSGNGSGGDNSGSNSDTGLRSTARAER